MNHKAIFILFLLIGCGYNNAPKTEKADTTAHSLLADTIPPEASGRLKYLFSANGGLLGFYDNGSVVGCPHCDLSDENIATLNTLKPHDVYAEYSSHLQLAKGGRMDLFESGKIISDWVVVRHQKVKAEGAVQFIPSDGRISMDSIQVVDETCLLIPKIEERHFDDESSEEAENYFTAMDDLAYYLSETYAQFESIHVKIVNCERRYLLFKLSSNDQIIVDTESEDRSILALLYKKGEYPIDVDIASSDMTNSKNYLK